MHRSKQRKPLALANNKRHSLQCVKQNAVSSASNSSKGEVSHSKQRKPPALANNEKLSFHFMRENASANSVHHSPKRQVHHSKQRKPLALANTTSHSRLCTQQNAIANSIRLNTTCTIPSSASHSPWQTIKNLLQCLRHVGLTNSVSHSPKSNVQRSKHRKPRAMANSNSLFRPSMARETWCFFR